MKIYIENLGILRQAEFSIGELTIICGMNNTGKTYATYALFGFLSYWKENFIIQVRDNDISQLRAEGVVHIDLAPYIKQAEAILAQGCQEYTNRLSVIFATSEERFENTVFQVSIEPQDIQPLKQYDGRVSSSSTERFSITKDRGSSELVVSLLASKKRVRIPHEIVGQFVGNAIKDILFKNVLPVPFIASAERTGAAIFRKELNFTRNRLLEEMTHADKTIDPMELLFKVYQDYPLPVKENVEFTRDLESIATQRSFLAKEYPSLLKDFADIIGGEYTVTQEDELYFVPKRQRVKLSMDESSSSVRALLAVGFYLRHVVERGDLLMVDEPELNLHPENQRRMARLFAQLVNLGIKIFVTTHSDYFIKELNTLIMLNHDKLYLKQIAQREGYQQKELISSGKIKVYIAEEALVKPDGYKRSIRVQSLVPANIDPVYGIEARSFDTTIETMNRIQEEIIWGDN